MIRNARGSLLTTINQENQYKEKVERLLTYLQKEYHLDWKIEMRLFILYNLQLEIINFLYKNYRKAEC